MEGMSTSGDGERISPFRSDVVVFRRNARESVTTVQLMHSEGGEETDAASMSSMAIASAARNNAAILFWISPITSFKNLRSDRQLVTHDR